MPSRTQLNLKLELETQTTLLRIQKSLLSEKLDVLSKLDNELIEMVAKEELDHEVEQADIIQGKDRSVYYGH